MGLMVPSSIKTHASFYIEQLQDTWVTHSYVTKRKRDKDRDRERNQEIERLTPSFHTALKSRELH